MSGISMKTQTAGNENDCVWMQAGVVKKKDCRQGYRCKDCVFDKALRNAVRDKRGGIVSWKDRLRERP
ncbi:MAG: hypothetical protein P8Y00_03715, partial [Deltaproteobacteria bacterium]